MSDEPVTTETATWTDRLKLAPWALPLLYLLGGGTMGVGGMSLSLVRGSAEDASEPAQECEPVECACATSGDLDAVTAAARAHHIALETLIERLETCEPSG